MRYASKQQQHQPVLPLATVVLVLATAKTLFLPAATSSIQHAPADAI